MSAAASSSNDDEPSMENQFLEQLPVDVLFDVLVESGNVHPETLAVTREMRQKVNRVMSTPDFFEKLSRRCFPKVTRLPADSAYYLKSGRYGRPTSVHAQNAAWRAHFARMIGYFGGLRYIVQYLVQLTSNHKFSVLIHTMRSNPVSYTMTPDVSVEADGREIYHKNVVFEFDVFLDRLDADKKITTCQELMRPEMLTYLFQGLNDGDMVLSSGSYFNSKEFSVYTDVGRTSFESPIATYRRPRSFSGMVFLENVDDTYVDAMVRYHTVVASVPRFPQPQRMIYAYFTPFNGPSITESVTVDTTIKQLLDVYNSSTHREYLMLIFTSKLPNNIIMRIIFNNFLGIGAVRLDQLLADDVNEINVIVDLV